jgi:hypothetical protein
MIRTAIKTYQYRTALVVTASGGLFARIFEINVSQKGSLSKRLAIAQDNRRGWLESDHSCCFQGNSKRTRVRVLCVQQGQKDYLPDLLDFRFHRLCHVRGQRGIGKGRGHFLAVVDHPVQEVDDNLASRRVLGLAWNE